MGIIGRITSDLKLMLQRPPRQQFAAICHRTKKKTGDLEVLLITSRDTGRWVIPKGWHMPGKQPHSIAEPVDPRRKGEDPHEARRKGHPRRQPRAEQPGNKGRKRLGRTERRQVADELRDEDQGPRCCLRQRQPVCGSTPSGIDWKIRKPIAFHARCVQ